MPFKRPAPLHRQSSSNQDIDTRPSKQNKRAHDDLFKNTKIFLVHAKLSGSDIGELVSLVEENGGQVCINIQDAQVVVTAIGMRKRLERHLDWREAKEKAIVKPTWIRDSVEHGQIMPCGSYAALSDLRDLTVKHCPDTDIEDGDEEHDTEPSCSSSPRPQQQRQLTQGQLPSPPNSGSARTTSPPLEPQPSVHSVQSKSKSAQTKIDTWLDPRTSSSTVSIPPNLLPPFPPIPTNLKKLDHKSRYACCRASPLTCPNQTLIQELNIIRKSREVEGEERSALSYQRAIAAIKAFPDKIKSPAQVKDVPYLGVKILGLIEEFLDTGRIEEARTIATSPRHQTLTLFTSLYGIGPPTARKLYALGLRTVEDLERWYNIDQEGMKKGEGAGVVEVRKGLGGGGGRWKGGRGGKPRGWEGEGEHEEGWVKIALGLREELAIGIPRDEVEEIHRIIMRELNEHQPGCVSTVVGGYRRGKPTSNDVDIVFTHPDREKAKGTCGTFVRRLHEKGLVTHVMHLSGFHAHDALRTTHWDSLEKALTVFVLPASSPFATAVDSDGGTRTVRRRVDLIFALPEVYWTAVIGWTGSIMFQRDLRQWAKDRGMKFDSAGITRRRDSKLFFPKTEKEAFDLFDLDWVAPEWRNADA